MHISDTSRFATQFELNLESGGEWLFGKFCYWISEHRVGRYDEGTSPWETTRFNARLQPTLVGLGRVTYSFGYRYDLLDNLVQERYPSGRVVSTPHDFLSRVTGVFDASRVFASDYRHSLHGVPVSLKLGNGLWETTRFNVRLQPTLVGLGTSPDQLQPNFLSLAYEYWPGSAFQANNGNVHKQTIVAPGGPPMVQSYTYDAVNRLKTATETGAWSQTYDYDRFGNRWVSAGYLPQPGSTPTSTSHFDHATNRMWLGMSQYDNSGNLTQDPAGRVSTYDAENCTTSSNSGNVVYRYDAEGRRVLKQIGTEKTVYVYDALGRLSAEYGGPPVFAGVRYLTRDPLGSTRVVTDQNSTVVGRHDFLPFGEEIPKTIGPRLQIGAYEGLDAVRHRFTGKERDFEAGRDYFGARYFSGPQGRFTSPDPAFNPPASIADPQRWNRYTYVMNNPLRYVDPDGKEAAEAWARNRELAQLRALGPEAEPSYVKAQDRGLVAAGVVAAALLAPEAAPAAIALGRAFASETMIALGLLGPKVGQMIAGPYGEVSRRELDVAASAGGPTISVLTRQASAPEAGRGLSVAAGEGAQALTDLARSGGKLFSAEIPQALLKALEKAGLVVQSTTQMKGGAQATEYRFLPQATEFIARYFTEESQGR
jgi:RHS repeat-associated protein